MGLLNIQIKNENHLEEITATTERTTVTTTMNETSTSSTTTTTKVLTTEPKITTTEKTTVTTTKKPKAKKHTTTTTEDEETTKKKSNKAVYSASKFRNMGVVHWGGWRWTWYSEKVLPGNGLRIPGRHNDENNYVCDENDYICLASSTLSRGTVIDTPFGKQGKIYDSGCASDTIDVYVGW